MQNLLRMNPILDFFNYFTFHINIETHNCTTLYSEALQFPLTGAQPLLQHGDVPGHKAPAS